MLDNRELASFIWLTIASVALLFSAGVRKSVFAVGRCAMTRTLIVPFALLVVWVFLETKFGAYLGIWNTGLLKDSIFWFLGSAVVLFVSSTTAWKEDDFFQRTIRSTVKFAAFLTFFLNFYVFHILVEIVLQPVLLVLTATSAMAATKPELKPAKKFADGTLAFVGISVLAFVSYRLVNSWTSIDWLAVIHEITLPIWLTIGLLPFIYALSVYAVYESAYIRLNVASDDKAGRRQALTALIRTFHIYPRELATLRGYWAKRVAEAPSASAAHQVIDEFRSSTQATRDSEHAKKLRLVQNAGAIGVDSDGRQLDQREFEETRQALRTLAAAQMGWYRNRGGRYQLEVLSALQPTLERGGLPSAHDIQMYISSDGQAWWAWRRTVTGWCFAIGAAEPPPDQWLYDGPDPPTGFPGEDATWGEKWGINAANW